MSDEWYGKKADKAVPLTDTFIRACIKTGALTPPPGDEIARVNRLVLWVVLIVMFVGAVVSWVAFLWR